MSTLAVVIALVLFAATMTLLFHPLLRFLKISEVPAALLACVTGRLNRRRLAFILRSRRQVYLEDIACLPPGPLWIALAWNSAAALVRRRLALAWEHGPLARPSREKILVSGHAARALRVPPASVSARGIGPRFAGVAASRPVASFGDDWRERLPARNPWSAQVNAELAVHRARMSETARWANVEQNWRDIR